MERAIIFNGKEMVFNIPSGIGTSLPELIDLAQSFTGKHHTVNNHKSRSFDVKTNILDNSLAGSQLEWRPVTPLRQDIEMTAAWLEKLSDGTKGP